MIVWFDIVNAPHARLFAPLINWVKGTKGLKTLVTAREYGYLTDLLKSYGCKFEVIGQHGGGEKRRKLTESMKRLKELYDLISSMEDLVLLSKASPEAVYIAYLLNIPSFTSYDNEHNQALCRITFPVSNVVFVPSVFPRERLRRYGVLERQTAFFDGVFEVAHVKWAKISKRVLTEVDATPEDRIIVARTEPLQSSYLAGYGRTLLVAILQELFSLLRPNEKPKIVVFPREEREKLEIVNRFGSSVFIPERALDTLSLLYYSSAFLGGGGTMTREAAVMGVPAISFYPGAQLAVTERLIEMGLIKHSLDKREIARILRSLIRSPKRAPREVQRLEDPLYKMVLWVREQSCLNIPYGEGVKPIDI